MSYAPIRSETTCSDSNASHPSAFTFSRRAPSKPSPGGARRAVRRNAKRKGAARDFPILIHSHLCWDWVWQRPQQFASRLSRKHRVLFVETLAPSAELAAPLARFRTLEAFPNLTVLTLQFPAWRWEDGEYVDSERRRLVQEFVAGPCAGEFDAAVQWFYDPMAFPAFAGRMGEALTVYDCMDELSRFRYAPPEIAQRERELLDRADVVFTGGRKLFEAKSRLHGNCHFYGCGVDGDHFGKARAARTKVPEEVAALNRPVLGYFGVIDERIDYELLSGLADAKPGWSVVMVGPVIKVEQESLPRRPNLVFLGQRNYADLPALAKGFDVCLMPFALNEATEFINPTKALEYMATGRPIVSTAVPDVVRNFGSAVKIARTGGEFITLCELAVRRPDRAAVRRGLEMAGANSWEAIVERLEKRVKEALSRKKSAGARLGRRRRNGGGVAELSVAAGLIHPAMAPDSAVVAA